MFVPIDNTPRPYAWGSPTAIAELLGRTPGGGPEAELWFGAHPGSPSRILDPSLTDGAASLDAWLAADPRAALGAGRPGRLPFLLKLLAAAQPLSLQAHPDPVQARAGFAREESAGLARDDPARDYKDPFAKPEMLVAISPFDALCGFRPRDESRAALAGLAAAPGLAARHEALIAGLSARLGGPEPLADIVAWLLGDGAPGAEVSTPQARLVDAVVAAASAHAGPLSAAPRLVRLLARHHPGDPGIVLGLLLNEVHLEPGEAIHLPAGNIHAYLGGLGIELMVASDNVLRGGLTRKHVNVPELLRILDCTPRRIEPFAAITRAPGVDEYRPCEDFALLSLRPASGTLHIPPAAGPAILLGLDGALSVRGETARASLGRGECLYATPDEGALEVDGQGWAVLATAGQA